MPLRCGRSVGSPHDSKPSPGRRSIPGKTEVQVMVDGADGASVRVKVSA